jgi:hypothetical protein
LDSSSEPVLGRAGCGVHLVAVQFAEHEKVDVADRSVTVFAREPCRPRSVDVCRVDALDSSQLLPDHPRHAEGFDKYVRQTSEVGARHVGSNEPCPPMRRLDTSPAASALDFAMN